VEPGLPDVFCDRTRVREVLLNLLSNAGRFTEHGGVRVNVKRHGDDLLIAITDTGRGIATGDLERLFQPFQQADGTIRRRYGGTGLGLSISKRFVELHGGKIWVESQEGRGSTFYIRLPLAPEAVASSSPGSAYVRALQPGWEYLPRTQTSTAPRLMPRPRLSVVESGDVVQRLLERYLDGIEIAPARDLEAALGQMAEEPSQALLINAPSVSAVLPRVQAAQLPPGLPTIICSVPEVHQSARELGAMDYLVKPVARVDLLAALERLELRGNTVLVVDDEPEALQLFRRMLASAEPGYRVLRARDGIEGLKILREERPDALLMDLAMPGMDGFRLLEAKSQDAGISDIPVIILSARDPTGYPVISSVVVATRTGGLSAPHLLECVKALTEILSAGSAGRGLPATAPG
jgi:CheY-like chemotaxis protein